MVRPRVHPPAGCPAWTRRACRQVAGGPDNWDTSKQNSQAGSYNTVGSTGDPEAHQYAERNIERAKQVRDGQTERGMLLKETSLHKNTVGGVQCRGGPRRTSHLALERSCRLGVGACCRSGAQTVHTWGWLMLKLYGGVPVPDEPADGCQAGRTHAAARLKREGLKQGCSTPGWRCAAHVHARGQVGCF